uniref:Uncharacterized protein n=1 Tax=Oryza rufipogon TaxID=4529 RepID=A0A0E0RFD2_ORYRU
MLTLLRGARRRSSGLHLVADRSRPLPLEPPR